MSKGPIYDAASSEEDLAAAQAREEDDPLYDVRNLYDSQDPNEENFYELGDDLETGSRDTGTLTRERGDSPPPVPTTPRPSQRRDSGPVAASTSDDNLYADLKEVLEGVEITEDQKKESARLAKVTQALEDQKKAAAGFKDVQGILAAEGELEKQREAIAEKQKEKPVDFGLSSFFSFVGAMLGLDDEGERKAGLAQVMKEFAFLEDETLSQDDRIANVIKAEKAICGKSTTEERAASPKEEPHALSEASKKKVQEQVAKDREKFLKEADKDSGISKKAMAITAGKAATCITLSVMIPGFGIIMAGAFLYLTRNVGVDDTTEKEKLKDELEQARRDLDVGERGKRGDYRNPAPSNAGANPLKGEKEESEQKEPPVEPTHLAAASSKVADDIKVEVIKDKKKLLAAQQALPGVGENSNDEVVSPPANEELYENLEEHRAYGALPGGVSPSGENATTTPGDAAVGENPYDIAAGGNEANSDRDDNSYSKEAALAAFEGSKDVIVDGEGVASKKIPVTVEQQAKLDAAKAVGQ